MYKCLFVAAAFRYAAVVFVFYSVCRSFFSLSLVFWQYLPHNSYIAIFHLAVKSDRYRSAVYSFITFLQFTHTTQWCIVNDSKCHHCCSTMQQTFVCADTRQNICERFLFHPNVPIIDPILKYYVKRFWQKKKVSERCEIC